MDTPTQDTTKLMAQLPRMSPLVNVVVYKCEFGLPSLGAGFVWNAGENHHFIYKCVGRIKNGERLFTLHDVSNEVVEKNDGMKGWSIAEVEAHLKLHPASGLIFENDIVD